MKINWVVSQQEVPIKNVMLQPKLTRELEKGQKEEGGAGTSYQPPRNAHTGIHLGWEGLWFRPHMGNKQDDWPETTQKPAALAQTPRQWAMWQLLSTGAPLPNKVFCFVSTCVSSDHSFPSVWSHPQALETLSWEVILSQIQPCLEPTSQWPRLILFFLVLFFNLFFLLNDICFTEFCCFLSKLNMNQPQVYLYLLPFESHSHLPPHPIPPGWYRAPIWVSWAIQQILVGYLFNRW